MTAATTSTDNRRTLWDIGTVASRLGVETRHVRRLVSERRIPFIKWGRLLRFDPAEIEAWLDQARRPPAAGGVLDAVAAKPPSGSTRPIFQLYDCRMRRTRLRAKGQLTLPEEIRTAARLEEGDLLEAEITEDGILLRPQKLIDATQAWFWTPEWVAGEREADADLAAGRGETFESGEAFIAALRQLAKPAPKRRP